jgi:hypothetical protein
VLAWAKDHNGDSYRMGAAGPTTWDCSSFTQAADAQIGVHLPRTATAQWNWLVAGHGTSVQPGQEKPGELIFWDSYLATNQIGHVMIIWNPANKPPSKHAAPVKASDTSKSGWSGKLPTVPNQLMPAADEGDSCLAVPAYGAPCRACRAGSQLRPHSHKLLARPLQAPSSVISPVGSYATALAFLMSEPACQLTLSPLLCPWRFRSDTSRERP